MSSYFAFRGNEPGSTCVLTMASSGGGGRGGRGEKEEKEEKEKEKEKGKEKQGFLWDAESRSSEPQRQWSRRD